MYVDSIDTYRLRILFRLVRGSHPPQFAISHLMHHSSVNVWPTLPISSCPIEGLISDKMAAEFQMAVWFDGARVCMGQMRLFSENAIIFSIPSGTRLHEDPIGMLGLRQSRLINVFLGVYALLCPWGFSNCADPHSTSSEAVFG